jgi:hypothetical protein
LCDDPPPQPAIAMDAKTINGAASAGRRRRLLINSRTETNKTSVQMTRLTPGGKLSDDIVPAVPGAVVATVTVTGAAACPVRLTEPGKVQLGAGITAGVMLHVKFTVPLNAKAGMTIKLKVALFPAAMVDELDDPGAGPMVKSGLISNAKPQPGPLHPVPPPADVVP